MPTYMWAFKNGNVSYSCFNLPSEMDFGNNQKLNYHYDGSGRKLTKIYTPGGYYPTNTEYRGQMVHQSTNGTSSLKYIITPEGRLKNTGTNAAPVWGWEYDLKDHLGNVRVTFKPNATNNGVVRVEYANYFPFGMKMLSPYSSSSTNKYLYNGKEMQDDFGLNWYDYGARFYDAAIGRFTTIDPLVENYYDLSPYGYCAGNPIGARDENGEWINFVVGAAIGAVVDAGLQAVEIALDDNRSASDFSWKSVGVSAASGAVGAGIISKVGKAMKVAELTKTAIKVGAEVATDATASAANQLVTTGKVDLQDVAIDAAAGQLIGSPVGKIVKGNAQSSQTGKVLKRQADRAQRVASGEGTRPARTNAAEKATEKASNYGTGRAAATGTASSNAASTYVKRKDDENKK